MIILYLIIIIIVTIYMILSVLGIMLNTLRIPFLILFGFALIKIILDYKKNGINIFKGKKYTSKRTQLYAIINQIKPYHKIVASDKYKLDLILISEIGIYTFNILDLDGIVFLDENNNFVFKKTFGTTREVADFYNIIDLEVSKLKKIKDLNIKKYIIRGYNLIWNIPPKEGFNIEVMGSIFYHLEKEKEKILTPSEVDQIYEMVI